MDQETGDLAERGLHELLRTLFRERESGALEVTVEGSRRRLFFRGGELHLPASNPLAKQLGRRLEKGRRSAEVVELLERMAGVLAGWREGTFAFEPGLDRVPDDAVGPLPTAGLVMATATLGFSDAELLERLGGTDALLISRPPQEEQLRSVRLEKGEIQLLDLLSQPHTVEEVWRSPAASRREVLERLCRLEAVGLLQSRKQRVDRDSLVNPEVLQRFSERVVRGLAARAADLEPTAHRAKLADRLGRLGEVNHYELLGIEPDAETDEVHTAYDEFARLVHPLHAARLGLQGREEALRLLFERATEAYLVLTDPERRRRYNRETGLGTPLAKDLQEEARRRSREAARQYYLRAREMFGQEEYHYALELLRQAVKADPQPEQYALMAEVQLRNPKWLRHAADSYREAIQLAPNHVVYRLALAQLYEQLEDVHRARSLYRSILVREPGHEQASEAIQRLEAGSERRPGFLSRLFGGE